MTLRPATPRSYGDGDPMAQALDVVGERWGLLVARELLWGPRRFTDLRAALPGIATNILSQRLLGLEAGGVVARVSLPPPARDAYALTPRGEGLRAPLLTLASWAAEAPGLRRDLPVSEAAAMLGLLARWDPDRAEGLRLTIDLRLGGDWALRVRKGRLHVERGRGNKPNCVVAGQVEAVLAALRGEQASLEVEGDPKALARLAKGLRR